MTLKELIDQLETLAAAAAQRTNTDDVVLIAGILYTTFGALYGGDLRAFAIYIARFNAELLRGSDADKN